MQQSKQKSTKIPLQDEESMQGTVRLGQCLVQGSIVLCPLYMGISSQPVSFSLDPNRQPCMSMGRRLQSEVCMFASTYTRQVQLPSSRATNNYVFRISFILYRSFKPMPMAWQIKPKGTPPPKKNYLFLLTLINILLTLNPNIVWQLYPSF